MQADQSESPGEPTGARPRVVLVVEDDAATRELFVTVLELEGYLVETCFDGASGLGRLEAGGIDLVILDIILPTLDGLEVCRRLRATPGTAGLPVVALSAQLNADWRAAALAAGADRIIPKPFDLDAFLAVVRALLAARPTP